MTDTSNSVRIERHSDIAEILVNNPPVNALSWHVRQGLFDSFESVIADDAVKAIVLRCDGATFIAGADISEFGKPFQGPPWQCAWRRP
jgi:3-hydroxyacyl-CoA dehydrogenase